MLVRLSGVTTSRPAEGAIEEVGVVVDVADRGEQHRLERFLGHDPTERGLPARELALGEGVPHALAVPGLLDPRQVLAAGTGAHGVYPVRRTAFVVRQDIPLSPINSRNPINRR
jgi:hypothetical protein